MGHLEMTDVLSEKMEEEMGHLEMTDVLLEKTEEEMGSNGEEESHGLLVSQCSTALEEPQDGGFKRRDKVLIDDFDVVESSVVHPFSWKKLWLFMGPGFLISIGFLDPGNLEGDLQAGAIAGYSLLWLLMWATVMGLLVQMLSARLGVVTGKHLAELCREEYPPWARYFLWIMAEMALIGADIQEVIGTAIAIQILSRGFFPLWAGVIITASDSLIFLFLENYGVRKLEAVFAILIGTMALSFAWMFVETKPDTEELILGIVLPRLSSRTIRQAVGAIGCVVMPHNVFLHSALVQSRKTDSRSKKSVQEALKYYTIESSLALFLSFVINVFVTAVFAKEFYGSEKANAIGLVNAGKYLQARHGRASSVPVLYIWGIGLLAAGQSSTITGTYAGQFIMGGFLDLPMRKWLRSLITRSSAILPTIAIAILFNRSESALDVMNEWINVLQSIQIPFALIPLLTLVSSEKLMGPFKIGVIMERVTWTVAILVFVINGYLLLDFFCFEVKGFVLGFAVLVAMTTYVAFIVYLMLRCHAFSNLHQYTTIGGWLQSVGR